MSGGAPLPQPTSEQILSIDDLKQAADKILPTPHRDFYNSGSTDQRTLEANTTSLSRYILRSRVLVDVRGLDTSTTALGKRVSFPLGCAPAGIQAIAHPDGELGTARAAAKAGVMQGISSYSSYSIQDIADAGREVLQEQQQQQQKQQWQPGHVIQMYPMNDRGLQERILQRAEDAGCLAVFLTGDSPVLGVRYNEWKNDFRTPEGIGFPIMETTSEDIRKTTHDRGFKGLTSEAASWESEVKWLRDRTKMKIFIKGVVSVEDVILAAKWGVDGVVISNHGGRQLDGVPATIDVLEECVEAAKGTGLEVHVDGGFRRGADVFVALALGASYVWVGRPVLWGLAYKGREGVTRMLEIFREDFRRCMALCGCVKVEDIHKGCLARMGLDGVVRRLKPRGGESKL